ncbi:hypothetical protein J2125_000961 [Erwinia toletana]|uniref:Uncharacterized protein n=1 Tax=Winslowiella toletana TaxID=92490 RepID=A0ABS4P577_9GAMM|nr:hypothetical protein [Winslowiella toletana]MBP2167769.1 hypothetical protein [Winslowiella toletana]
MKKFFKGWLQRQLRYFAGTFVPILLILIFGMLAVTWWPAFAWRSTVAFAALAFAVTFWLI